MKQRRRIYYSESQKALMWERWRKGESLQHIAQLFDRNHSSVQGILAQTGGIQPAPRQRSRLALTLAEREDVDCHLRWPPVLPHEGMLPDGLLSFRFLSSFLSGVCRARSARPPPAFNFSAAHT
ncbi:hypothetical protein OKW28_004705 [Paraburkholderia sp. 40]